MRLIIVAAVVLPGFLLNPAECVGQERAVGKEEARRDDSIYLRPGPWRFEPSPIAAPEARPCTPGFDDRHSDLCAQWKAADAAKAAADWSTALFWLSFAGTLIGCLTLIAAAFAAKFARDAAISTAVGAEEARRAASAAEGALAVTRDVGIAQATAYLYFEKVQAMSSGDAKPAKAGQAAGLFVYYEIGHSGASPAMQTVFGCCSSFYPFEQFPPERLDWKIIELDTVQPSMSQTVTNIHAGSAQAFQLIREGTHEMEIAVFLEYYDVFGLKRRVEGAYYVNGPDFNAPLTSTPKVKMHSAI